MRVLTIAWGVPFPPAGGGLTRTFHLLKALSQEHELVLAAFTYGARHDVPPFPVQVESVEWRWSRLYEDMTGANADVAKRAYEQLAFGVQEPWFASCLDPLAMEEMLERLRPASFDLVLLEGTPAARFTRVLSPEIPRVLDLLDVHSLMTRRELESGEVQDRRSLERDAQRTLAFERRAAQQSSLCIAVSDSEAAAVRILLHQEAVEVVPNGVDASYFDVSREREVHGSLLFTGLMNYQPNIDAACYMAEEVLPELRRRVPHARLTIVGMNPHRRVSALASEIVSVLGGVPDVRPYFEEAEVVVVPVREGGGTRLKLLEAAACGKAIVSTTLGAEGLDFRHREELLLADSASSFATCVEELLGNPRLRRTLGNGARAVARRYDWTEIEARFRSMIDRVCAPVRDA